MFYRSIFAITIGVFQASMACHVNAQTKEESTKETISRLEQVTVIGKAATQGAMLGGVELTELPLSAFVVSREEIERIRFVDPDDFLDRIPGETQVRNLRIPDGGKPYTVPLIDGMPLDDPYEGATSDIGRVNSFDIERIEVIKGPASALYANNAFGGVINVVTRGIASKQESRVWAEAGEFGHKRIGASSTGAISSKLGYLVDVNTLNSDGLRDNYETTNPNNFPDAVKNDRSAFSGKLLYQPSDKTELTVRYEHVDRDEVTATDLPQSSFDLDETLILSNGSGNPDVSFEEVSSQAVYVKAVHKLDFGELNFSSVGRDVDVEGDGRFSDPQIEDQDSISAKLWYQHDFNTSNLIIGAENFKGQVNADVYNGDDLNFTGELVDHTETDQRITALFAQYMIKPSDDLTITLGARQEKIKTDSLLGSAEFDDVAPKFGVSYDVNRNNNLWLGLSEGFLAPSPEDLFDPDEGDANLKPEEADHIEFGLRGSVGKLSYSSAYYHTRIKNFIYTQEVDSDNDGILDADQTSNAAQVTVQGLESVIEYNASAQWRLSFTHTYSRNVFDSFVQSTPGADDDLSGNSLSRSPKHHLNARVAWLPLVGLIVELENDFYSSYTTSDDELDPLGTFTRDPRIDLRINYVTGSWTVWLNALNLTDTLEDRVSYSGRSGERSFRLIDGRNFQVGTSYSF